MSLFRREVIDAKRRKLWGEVRLAQPPSFQAWTAVLAFMCLALATVVIFGHYTRKETVTGFITPEAGVTQVRAVQPGRISGVLLREGQRVVQGDPMIEFASDLNSLGEGPALDLQIEQADRQIQSLHERRKAIVVAYAGDRDRIQGQITAQEELHRNLERQRQVQIDALAIAEQEASRFGLLQSQGYVPAAEAGRRRRAVLSEKTLLADLESRVAQAQASITDLRMQLSTLPSREIEALSDVDGGIAAVAQRRVELQVTRGYIIRAPVSGTVSGIQARVGMTPSAELPLLSISPDGSPLEAHLLVPTRAAGFLRAGQAARLQVAAFPFQRFGFIEGTVIGISTTVSRPGDVPFPVAQTEPVYEVRVRLARSYVDAYGERRPLQPGMALTADIAIDRRALWQMLFDPLLAAGRGLSLS